jgi:hypothetical protein
MSYRLISKATFDLFSEQLSIPTAIAFVEKFSKYYQRTENLLLRDILDGPVVHLDETRINIMGANQYVWVFTDNARVVFRLRPNREAEFLQRLFSTFKGTVVTDFYGGYDALPCTQQKCLVHLIRDLNDDLWKNPFDDELEGFVTAVRDLLVPLLEDVQRFGPDGTPPGAGRVAPSYFGHHESYRVVPFHRGTSRAKPFGEVSGSSRWRDLLMRKTTATTTPAVEPSPPVRQVRSTGPRYS